MTFYDEICINLVEVTIFSPLTLGYYFVYQVVMSTQCMRVAKALSRCPACSVNGQDPGSAVAQPHRRTLLQAHTCAQEQKDPCGVSLYTTCVHLWTYGGPQPHKCVPVQQGTWSSCHPVLPARSFSVGTHAPACPSFALGFNGDWIA